MRALFSFAAAATVVLGVAAVPSFAQAAGPYPPPPPRVQGMNCAAVASKVGRAKTWQALYWGWRRDIFDRHDEQFLQAPCFTTQASCKAWLYWAQIDFPKMTVMKFCKTGAPY
ncbi:MAG: hypothetical protein WDM94_06730 [Bauldia sp.]